VRLWNPAAGQPLADPFAGHLDKVESVAVSPDGNRVASGSADTTVRLWPASATPKTLCDKLTTNMSHEQWRDWVSPEIPYRTACSGLPIAPD